MLSLMNLFFPSKIYIPMLVLSFENRFFCLILHFIILSKGMILLMIYIWKILMLLIHRIDLVLLFYRIQLAKILLPVKISLKTVHPAALEALLTFQVETAAALDPMLIPCQHLRRDRRKSSRIVRLTTAAARRPRPRQAATVTPLRTIGKPPRRGLRPAAEILPPTPDLLRPRSRPRRPIPRPHRRLQPLRIRLDPRQSKQALFLLPDLLCLLVLLNLLWLPLFALLHEHPKGSSNLVHTRMAPYDGFCPVHPLSRPMFLMLCKMQIGDMLWMRSLMLYIGITHGGWFRHMLVKMSLIVAGFIKSNASPMGLLIDIRPDW
jgi:hypothetical protein